MSDFFFPCPYCQQRMSSTQERVGETLQCPKCKKEFVIAPPVEAVLPKLSQLPSPVVSSGRQQADNWPADSLPPLLNPPSELEQKILEGGRFVVFQYCFSVLILSFKRPSSLVYVPPGEDGAGPALSNSLISLIVGWWGIPWGPIWTISTVINNLRGGIDVTQSVLAGAVGAGRAAQIMAQRRIVPPRKKRLRVLRWSLAGFATLAFLWLVVPFILAMIIMLVNLGKMRNSGDTAAFYPPGAWEFHAANRQIITHTGKVGFGNSPQAAEVATEFASTMKVLREKYFESGKASGYAAGGGEFPTYCELRSNKCAIIVEIPELRHFDSEAKEKLGALAWQTAQSILHKQLPTTSPETKLAVGLRGITYFDRVLTGTVASPNQTDGSLEATVTTGRPETALFPYFQSQPTNSLPK